MAYRSPKKYLDKTLNKNFLTKEYIINKKSCCQIALECKCHCDTVIKYLKKYNFIMRSAAESRKIKYWLYDNKNLNLTKEILEKEYHNNKFTIKELSEKYNLSEASIFRRLKYFNIKTRGNCHKLSLNPNWIDGRSYEPYTSEFNEILKEQIRKRDNYKCQNCDMTEEEHLIVMGYNLIIHHIDYNKKNCKEDNLITLCNSCNVRANYNRDYWNNYYLHKIGVIHGAV